MKFTELPDESKSIARATLSALIIAQSADKKTDPEAVAKAFMEMERYDCKFNDRGEPQGAGCKG